MYIFGHMDLNFDNFRDKGKIRFFQSDLEQTLFLSKVFQGIYRKVYFPWILIISEIWTKKLKIHGHGYITHYKKFIFSKLFIFFISDFLFQYIFSSLKNFVHFILLSVNKIWTKNLFLNFLSSSKVLIQFYILECVVFNMELINLFFMIYMVKVVSIYERFT